MTSREQVNRTLEFRSPNRVPRQLWTLPWAGIHCGEELRSIERDFPQDIVWADGHAPKSPAEEGDPYEIGESVDPWGAKFVNVQRGVIGEVKEPLVIGENWEDSGWVHIPHEQLAIDAGAVNAQCARTGAFVLASACPRPFEQLQFLRGTENLYLDLAYQSSGLMAFIEKMHDFYCRWVEAWAETDVDGIMMMDDWGSQKSLLINPKTWDGIFRPMYRDYIDIAKRHGKKTFMHSDGYTLEIIPRLIDLGLDALNTQIFCVGLEKLRQFRGKITFWGEIDRQYLLAQATPAEVAEAVRLVYDQLWAGGGCIAQCEFGAGAKPENVRAVFRAWNEVL